MFALSAATKVYLLMSASIPDRLAPRHTRLLKGLRLCRTAQAITHKRWRHMSVTMMNCLS